MIDNTRDRENVPADENDEIPRKRKHKQRFNRSKSGCLSCRRRKIRCDQVHPICERCTEVKTECVWPTEPSSSSSRASPVLSSHHFMPTLDDAFMAINTWPSHPAGREEEGRSGGTGGLCDFTEMMIGDNYGGLETSGGVSGGDLRHAGLSTPVFNSVPPAAGPSSRPASSQITNLVNSAATSDLFGAYTFADLFTPGTDPSSQDVPRPTLPQQDAPGEMMLTIPNDLSTDSLLQPSVRAPISFTNSILASRRRPNIMPVMMAYSLSIPPVIEEPIEHTFPSADSKRLFQHVRSKTSTVIVALGMGSHEAKNPFMAMVTRLMRVDPESAAQTAFRHSLLSLGSAHQMRVRTVKSKRKATLHLFIPAQKQEVGYTDLLLATCLTLHLRNKLWADSLWKQSLDIAIRHITRCGGPGPLLSHPNQHCDRRFLLEQLAVADLFSTFTTGDEPLLLGHDAMWWEDGSEKWLESQWESFERCLGFSREMTRIIAQYRVILSRSLAIANDDGPENKASRAARDGLIEMSNQHIESLRLWSAGQTNVPRRRRIINGDSAYRYMMVISLLVEVQSVDIADTRVQSAAHSVLELCSEMSQEPVNLLWPLLTAASCAISQDDRDWARQLFATSRTEYCKDLEIAEVLLQEQWTRLDCGKQFTAWPVVMRELQHHVCIL